ncbi:MAG: hypothetical protein AAGE94_21910 [Acidobacteriota bacterium]
MRSMIRLLSLALLGSFLSLGVLIAAPTGEVTGGDDEAVAIETVAIETVAIETVAIETTADPMSLDEALPGLAIPEVVEATDCCFVECEQGYFDCMRECKAAGGTSMSCSPVCSAERDDCLAGC